MVPVLVDSSAWVEFLRATGSPAHREVRRLLEDESPIATTDVVVMELLAGAPGRRQQRMLWSLLNRARMLPVRPLFDYEAAATLYLGCRSAGVTPRSLIDCLIAVVAIHHRVPLLHADADFERIARVTDLELA